MYDPITEFDRKQEEYLSCLENIHLKLFPDMNVKQILFNETAYCLKTSVKGAIKKIIKTIFFKNYYIKKNINNKKILLLYTKNYRVDHDEYWEKIKNDILEYDYIEILTQDLKKIDKRNIVKKICYFYILYKKLNVVNEWKDRIFLTCSLVDRKLVLDEIQIMELKPKITMCFSDNSPDENVLMQYFHQQGATTVTNQHGLCIFQSYEFDRLNQSQILNFKCDYYFSRGSKQQEQFILAGYNPEKIKVIGFIGTQMPKIPIRKNEVLGIYLDCPTIPMSKKNNIKMIAYAKQIAKKIGWKYFIKCHPQDFPENYEDVLDMNCLGIFGKEATLKDTFEKATICITHASATYVDGYIYGLRCLKMNSEIYYPIAVPEDEFNSLNQSIEKINDWIHTSDVEKGRYIQKVRNQYASPWKDGNINNELNIIINEKG